MKALITGSGFEAASFGTPVAEHQPNCSLGKASDKVFELELDGSKFLWLRRHGAEGAIAPHKINYRANIHALSDLGVTQIIAINTVGGISEDCQPGSFVIADQIMDLSWGRDSSFFDGEYFPLQHIDFTQPFDQELRNKLLSCADSLPMKTIDGGTYACTQGPRQH
jgi:5'-methylthioinosine phosphorylase